MGYFEGLPERTDLWDVIRAREDDWGFVLAASERIMQGPSALSRGERELIGAYVSGLNACDYCHGAHEAKARALGFDEEVTGRLLDDPASAPIEPKLRPVFALARKLTLQPHKTVAGDIRALREAGWDEDAVSSVIAVVSWFNFLNRVVFAHGCELRDDMLALPAAGIGGTPRERYEAYVKGRLEGD